MDTTIDSPAEEALEPAGHDESAENESDWKPADCVLDDLQYGMEYYRDWFEDIPEEIEFVLDQAQYDTDDGRTRDEDQAMAKDLSLLSASRRKWSQIAATPTYINCYPIDYSSPDDGFAAERTKWALEHEVYNPRKMYRRKRRRAIIGAVVGRVWYLLADWDAKLKEIVYRTKAPTEVIPCPGWQDAHDPQCPWVLIIDDIDVEEARQRARDYGKLSDEEIDQIQPDQAPGDLQGNKPSSRIPGMVNLHRAGGSGGPNRSKRNTVRIIRAMYREDPEAKQLDEERGEPIDLNDDEQYMRCATCTHETRDHSFDPETGQLPDVGDPCPVCVANGTNPDTAPRLQAVRQLQEHLLGDKYPDGRWIEILEKSRTVIYDDAWPYRKPDGTTLSSFPLAQFRIYDDPRHEIPNSDVSWQWNQQALATYMLQWGIEQMRTSGRVVFMPYRGIVDEKGKPWAMSNRLDQIAFLKDPMMANAVKEFQPAGLPQSWSTLYGALTNNFRSNMGSGELGLGPDQSKDLPVGTVHAIIESGDVPVADGTAMILDEEGRFLGVVGEMIQCCWDSAHWVRYLAQDGQYAYEYISGADLTGVDVMITGDPGFDILQSSKLDRMKVWFDMTPPQRRMAARWLNLEPSMVSQYEADEQMFMQQQAAMMAPPVPPAGGPRPGQQGPPSASGQAPPPRPAPAAPPPAGMTGENMTAPGLAQLSPALRQGLSSMVLGK